jgi:hypothetical protein
MIFDAVSWQRQWLHLINIIRFGDPFLASSRIDPRNIWLWVLSLKLSVLS